MHETSPLRAQVPSDERGSSPSDELLLDAIASGREHAFDLLVARWAPRVMAYARSLLMDRALAEDVTQEVFTKVHASLAEGARPRHFAVWVFRVTRNEALDLVREGRSRRWRLERLARGIGPGLRGLWPGHERAASAELERHELAAALEEAIARLPEDQRSAFLLREREGLGYGEIGAIVGAPVKTVSTRIHRARVRLRDELAGHLLEDGSGGLHA